METSLFSGPRRRRFRRRSSRFPFGSSLSGRRLVAALCLAAVVTLPASAQETPYKVELSGVEDGTLRSLLEGTSSLFRLVEEPPPSPIGLRRRADSDRDRLVTALRSAGYYDGSVEVAINTDVQPAQVDVQVTPGPAYTFDAITVASASGDALPGNPITAPDIGIGPGTRAQAASVVDGQARLTGLLAERGYAFARVTDRQAVVDHGTRTMDVAYTVDPGPLTRLGEVRVQGLERIDQDLVRNRIPWHTGDVYSLQEIEKARDALTDLNVFSTVRVDLAGEPGPEGVTPVTVTVAERPRRFLGTTLRYDTSEGVAGNVYWGHRNLFGGGENLRLSAEVGRLLTNDVSETEFGITGEFRKPDFLMLDQTLVLNAAVLREQPEAYQRDAITTSALLQRVLFEGFIVRYGVAAERSRVREKATDETTTSTLVGLPVGLTWDNTDNLLNPVQGFRTDLSVTPWKQIGGEGANFLVSRWTNSAYYDIADDGRWVLAGRFSLGSILGADASALPPDKRFYAGGGGSVRGYGYQEVGPRDTGDQPTGGSSLIELGAELRVKVTDTIGVVPFIDGGNVYEKAIPDFSGGLRWGAGLGLRYYTDFGPIRFDFAVPLNKQTGDDSFQIYISLGQAF
jgi:translocation and assembly module TamA